MGTLLDTSLLIQVERGLASLPEEDEIGIAAITASELLHGAHRADERHRAERERFAEEIFIAIPTIPFTLTIARVHARLWVELTVVGRVPGANDLIVAATALSLGWSVLTLDRRGFERIPGLRLASLA